MQLLQSNKRGKLGTKLFLTISLRKKNVFTPAVENLWQLAWDFFRSEQAPLDES